MHRGVNGIFINIPCLHAFEKITALNVILNDSMKNPLKQADRSKYRFIDLLEKLFKDTEHTDFPQYCMVESAVWFPSISKRDVTGSLPMEYHSEITLLENALDFPQITCSQLRPGCAARAE